MNNKFNQETFNHLKKVELLVLEDFIKICDENNLNYYLFYGTLIGAIRHHGFIPWDDDIDVVMFRDDYEKFMKIMESKNSDKYEILETRYQNDYFLLFAKMSLKNTTFGEYWTNQVGFNLGIFVDIFVLDNVPDNKIKRFFFKKYSFLLDKLLTMSAIKLDSNYSMPVRLISNAIHFILNKLGLTTSYFQKKSNKLFRKYDDTETEYVSDLTEPSQFIVKRSHMNPPKKVKFEDIEAKVPNDYDYILRLIYGDYMQIPPEEERITHIIENLDFGNY